MSVLIFLGVLFVLILVHEWGHYITAKLTGMRVDEFGIGFPPKLFGMKRGETVYTLNALPIGGFVKILGENGDDGAGEVLSEADKKRTFSARPKWAQAIVLLAGVTMNVLFGWLLLVVILMMGTSVQVTEEEATEQAVLTVAAILPDSPASVLPTGASITSAERGGVILGTLTPTAFSTFVGLSTDPVSVTYEMPESEPQTVSLTPKQGLLPDDPQRAVIGIQTALVEQQQYGFVEAVRNASRQTVQMLAAITVGLGQLLGNAIQGTADFSQVTGPVGIVEHVGTAASFGLTSLLFFTAVISFNLAVINLVPVPALDGGRLVFVAIEAVTRRPINPVWSTRLNIIGFGLLMLLMVVVTFNDIVKLIG
jgi:regulator of sigma E protease